MRPLLNLHLHHVMLLLLLLVEVQTLLADAGHGHDLHIEVQAGQDLATVRPHRHHLRLLLILHRRLPISILVMHDDPIAFLAAVHARATDGVVPCAHLLLRSLLLEHVRHVAVVHFMLLLVMPIVIFFIAEADVVELIERFVEERLRVLLEQRPLSQIVDLPLGRFADDEVVLF